VTKETGAITGVEVEVEGRKVATGADTVTVRTTVSGSGRMTLEEGM